MVYITGYDALFAGTKKNRPPINENSKVLIIGASGGTGQPGNLLEPLDDFILTKQASPFTIFLSRAPSIKEFFFQGVPNGILGRT